MKENVSRKVSSINLQSENVLVWKSRFEILLFTWTQTPNHDASRKYVNTSITERVCMCVRSRFKFVSQYTRLQWLYKWVLKLTEFFVLWIYIHAFIDCCKYTEIDVNRLWWIGRYIKYEHIEIKFLCWFSQKSQRGKVYFVYCNYGLTGCICLRFISC